MCIPVVQVRAAMPGMDSRSLAILPPITYLVCFLRFLRMGHLLSACCAVMTGMPVSEQNCHPFQWGRYLFMHNGERRSFLTSAL